MAGSYIFKSCYIFKTGRDIDLEQTGFDSWMIYASLNAKISEILFLKKFRYIAPLKYKRNISVLIKHNKDRNEN